jgi:glycosyltransferase involved in cell wall biosynthesis
MKVLNISLDKKLFDANSGVRRRVLEYAKVLERFDILVLAGGEKNESGNMAIWPVNSSNKLFALFKAYQAGKKMVKEYKPDLISAQDPFFTGLIGWLLKQKTGLPLQIQIHTDFLSPYFKKESLINKIRVCLARFIIPRADSARVVSERIKKSLLAGGCSLASGAIFVSPIFVDIAKIQGTPVRISLKEKYPQFDFIILMASRLSREKNISLAIEAFAEITKRHPKAGLIIAGEGPEKENLKFKISNLKLQTKVILEPWMEDLMPYYKTADIFLLASNYEGYGLAVLEAMACGLPVVMTDVGCAGEVVKNNKSGIIVPVNGARELEDALVRLISNESLRKKIGENARQAVSRLPLKEESLELYKKSLKA